MTVEIPVECSQEEKEVRLNFCKVCENFQIEESGITICKETGCNISFMVGFNFKQCPKENW